MQSSTSKVTIDGSEALRSSKDDDIERCNARLISTHLEATRSEQSTAIDRGTSLLGGDYGFVDSSSTYPQIHSQISYGYADLWTTRWVAHRTGLRLDNPLGCPHTHSLFFKFRFAVKKGPTRTMLFYNHPTRAQRYLTSHKKSDARRLAKKSYISRKSLLYSIYFSENGAQATDLTQELKNAMYANHVLYARQSR